jgi:hypothetical protein
VFRNGIFEFNITQLTGFINAHADHFPIEAINVASIPNYDDSRLDQATIAAAARMIEPSLHAEEKLKSG